MEDVLASNELLRLKGGEEFYISADLQNFTQLVEEITNETGTISNKLEIVLEREIAPQKDDVQLPCGSCDILHCNMPTVRIKILRIENANGIEYAIATPEEKKLYSEIITALRAAAYHEKRICKLCLEEPWSYCYEAEGHADEEDEIHLALNDADKQDRQREDYEKNFI